jgi:hypothetical protein
MTEAGEDYDRSVLLAPANVSLFVHIAIQTNDGTNPDTITAIAMNDLADAVEEAVTSATSRTGQSILGGLVQEAWVNGRQVVTAASSSNPFSEYVMATEIVLPRSR